MASLLDYGLDPKELEKQKQNDMGLLGLLVGGSMLAGNQPGSTMGQSLGQGLNAGAQGYMGMQQARDAQAIQQRQLAMQAAKPMFGPAGAQPMTFDPASGKYVNSGPPLPGKPTAPSNRFYAVPVSDGIIRFDKQSGEWTYLKNGGSPVQVTPAQADALRGANAGDGEPPTPAPTNVLPIGADPRLKRDMTYAGAKGASLGKEAGEAATRASSGAAALPQLEDAVTELKKLGEVATYTKAGQIRDTFLRETGRQMSEGGVARAKYIAHVANNILPLLRQTFGAAFTAAEGESLKATLGDPDMSPEEKNAVLGAFISDKKATLGTHKRETGAAPSTPQASGGPTPRRKFNPATGELE
jgi:hypothetical protein